LKNIHDKGCLFISDEDVSYVSNNYDKKLLINYSFKIQSITYHILCTHIIQN